jgi:hypothetical protein
MRAPRSHPTTEDPDASAQPRFSVKSMTATLQRIGEQRLLELIARLGWWIPRTSNGSGR